MKAFILLEAEFVKLGKKLLAPLLMQKKVK